MSNSRYGFFDNTPNFMQIPTNSLPPSLGLPAFNFSVSPDILASHQMPKPSLTPTTIFSVESKPPSFGLITGTAKSLLKESIPPAAGPVGLIASAAKTGQKLALNIDRALDEKQTPAQAYTCQTLKTLSEELAGKTMKGAIVGGVPAYLALAAELPPIALTLPVVLPKISEAYQGAEVGAKIVGNATEALCNDAFGRARRLSGGR